MPKGGTASPVVKPTSVVGAQTFDASEGLTVRDEAAVRFIGTQLAEDLARRGGCATENFAVDSDQLLLANWTDLEVTRTPNAADDPFGRKFAVQLVETVTAAAHRTRMTNILTPAGDRPDAFGLVIASCYIRPRLDAEGVIEREWCFVECDVDGGASARHYFNLDEGALGSFEESGIVVKSGNIERIQSLFDEDQDNPWFRCSAVFQLGSDRDVRLEVGLAQDDLTGIYAGDTSKGMFFFGAQLEPNASQVHCYNPNPEVLTDLVRVDPETYAEALYNLGDAVAQKKLDVDEADEQTEEESVTTDLGAED